MNQREYLLELGEIRGDNCDMCGRGLKKSSIWELIICNRRFGDYNDASSRFKKSDI